MDPTSETFAVEPQFHGAPMTMVDLINATLREEMRRNPDILVFGEDVADCTREASLCEVKGKGGVFKVTARLADGIRLAPRVQYAARGGGHCGPRHRHGDARAEAGGGDSVLRLHLAGDDATSRRTGDHALALQRKFFVSGGDPRADRRISERRRDLSQPVRRIDLHTHSGAARGIPE